jgi:hypothetical protein
MSLLFEMLVVIPRQPLLLNLVHFDFTKSCHETFLNQFSLYTEDLDCSLVIYNSI